MLKWPPDLPAKQKSNLEAHAITWATLNSLIVKYKSSKEENLDPVVADSISVHAPFALFPSPFPRSGFELAVKIQPLFNILVDRVANDGEFLDFIMKSLGDSDEFTSKIYDIYKKTAKDNLQNIVMGLHRSDYLVHYDPNNPNPLIKQVELNTIASSFSSLSQHTSLLHKFLCNRTDFYNDHAPGFIDIKPENLPENTSGYSIAEGLAKAWEIYGSQDTVVMMIVQPGETNIFDQIWIEQQLFIKYKIKLIRKSLAEVHREARLDGEKRLLYIGEHHVAVTYFRAGYSPNDYPSNDEWSGRLLIEKSYSVKCPNAAYHLAGVKKVQQVLAQPNVLEKFMNPEHSQLLRLCFTGLYPLDSSKEGLAAYQSALADPMKYVLKPQREGGGNNYYGIDVKKKLEQMSPSERNGYILMDLIKPPPLRNTMIRRGKSIDVDVISELGIYGIFVSQGGVVHMNKQGGFLLRTKSSESNEGGVAAGFAVLDSPLLV